MHRLGTALLIAGLGLPALGSQQVTVAQLEEQLAGSAGKADASRAKQLSDEQLTERLASARLQQLLAGVAGEKSREALLALADLSAFLPPPTADIPAQRAPDKSTQREIMARVVDYVGRTNHKLPNFFATRTTTRFEDWSQGLEMNGMIAGRYIPPHIVDTSRAIVTYRNGVEVVSAGGGKSKKKNPSEKGLSTWGIFGPVIATVLVDGSHSTVAWSRWEQDGERVLAVFHYAIPMEKSSYAVKFCCYPASSGALVLLDRASAYHGEITVDPDDGTILRLTLIADLDEGDLATLLQEAESRMPLSRADVMVEYGPVEIGGKGYVCPIRSVVISRAKVPLRMPGKPPREAKKVFPVHVDPPSQAVAQSSRSDSFEIGPAIIYINDVTFTDYHVFRSDSRILPFEDK